MIYRHYKGGLYRVLFEARQATNGQASTMTVVYVSLATGIIFVRDSDEFYDAVDGIPRFTLVETT